MLYAVREALTAEQRHAAASKIAAKAIFLPAMILMASPVAGFRPILAARFLPWRMPRPVSQADFVALLQMPCG